MKSETARIVMELGGTLVSVAGLVKSWPAAERDARFKNLLREAEAKGGLSDAEKTFWRAMLLAGRAWEVLMQEVNACDRRQREAEDALRELLG